MENQWLHRLAIAVAAFAVVLLVAGALLTDYRQAKGAPELISTAHLILAVLVSALTLVLAIGLSASRAPRWIAGAAWTGIVLLACAGGLARNALLVEIPRAAGALHALLAQLFFATLAVIIVGTSQSWQKGPDQVHDQGWPSLRFLGNTMLLLVLAQVSLGAAFRHKASGLLPHLVGAMIVALWILIVCMFVIQQFPEHPALRPAANVLLAVTLTQVCLGIAALTFRMLTDSNTPGLMASTAAHVTIGALTLASASVLTFQIRRNVLPKLAEEEEAEEEAAG